MSDQDLNRLYSLGPAPPAPPVADECEEGCCHVCGRAVDRCICPACPRCTMRGNPICYRRHGLVATAAQTTSLHTETTRRGLRRALHAEWTERLVLVQVEGAPWYLPPLTRQQQYYARVLSDLVGWSSR